MFDILSVKKPHRSLSILNRTLKQTTLKAHYGSRKGTIQNILQIRKNIQNRYLLDKSLLKRLSNRENNFKSLFNS